MRASKTTSKLTLAKNNTKRSCEEDIYDWAQATFGIERRYGVTHTAKLIEEMLEMFGTTLLWIGFLHYLAALLQQRSLRFVYYPTGRS